MTYQEYLALTPEQKAGWIEKPFFVDGKQAGISLTKNSETNKYKLSLVISNCIITLLASLGISCRVSFESKCGIQLQ